MHLDHLTPGTARVLLVLVWAFAIQEGATAAAYSSFEPQHLKVLAKGSTLEISWGSTQGHLESSSGPKGPWEALTNRAAFTDGRSVVTVPRDSGPRFYRLRQETFRAMTYNIHHGVGTDSVLDLGRIAAVINAQAPDLVGLQEVDNGTLRSGYMDQAAELGRLTGMNHFFGKNINYQSGGYGLGVLCRHPITSSKHVLYTQQNTQLEQRGVNVVQIDFGETDVFFFNTHLDHNTADAERLYQISQIKSLVQAYPSGKVLVCGDFNCTPDGNCYASMILDFVDAWPNASSSSGFTFPSTGPDERIDYFWMKMSEIKPVAGWIPSTLASDHLPTVVDFLLPASD